MSESPIADTESLDERSLDEGSLDEGFLTVAATATVLRDLHWASSALFELFVGWAGEVEPEHGEVAAWLSSTGRHLGEQAESLRALMPDSVLLSELTALGAPSAESESALEAVRVLQGSVVRLAVAQRVLLARLSESCESLLQPADPLADAPLVRAVGFLLLDLRNDRAAGELLLGALRGSGSDEQIDAATAEAERQLVSAGGLVPAGVLRSNR